MARLQFNGYELPGMSLTEAQRLAQGLRERLAPLAIKEIEQWYAERVVSLLDIAAFTPADALGGAIERALSMNCGADAPERPAPALADIALGRARLAKDPTVDTRAWLDLYPLEEATLCLVEARSDSLRIAAVCDERFTECHYVVGQEPPDDLSECEWRRRARLWRMAGAPSGDDRIERMRMQISGEGFGGDDAVVRHSAAMPGRRSLHDRVQALARQMTFDRCLGAIQAMASADLAPAVVYQEATRCAADRREQQQAAASILSDHLPAAYEPGGRECSVALQDLFDRTLHKRLSRALSAMRFDRHPRRAASHG